MHCMFLYFGYFGSLTVTLIKMDKMAAWQSYEYQYLCVSNYHLRIPTYFTLHARRQTKPCTLSASLTFHKQMWDYSEISLCRVLKLSHTLHDKGSKLTKSSLLTSQSVFCHSQQGIKIYFSSNNVHPPLPSSLQKSHTANNDLVNILCNLSHSKKTSRP